MMRRFGWLLAGLLALSACAEPAALSGEQVLAEVVERAEEAAAVTSTLPPNGSGATEAPGESREGDSAPEDAGTTTSTTTAPQATSASCATANGGGDHVAQLVDVRVGTHEGFDRVVFELAPSSEGPEYFGLPRYEMAAATLPITQDGSGEPIAVRGSSHATIVLHGASGVEFTDSEPGYRLTYDGPKELRTGFDVLAEVQQTGDFERTLSWAFGLDRATCWKVSVLENPLRLVVDFPH